MAPGLNQLWLDYRIPSHLGMLLIWLDPVWPRNASLLQRTGLICWNRCACPCPLRDGWQTGWLSDKVRHFAKTGMKKSTPAWGEGRNWWQPLRFAVTPRKRPNAPLSQSLVKSHRLTLSLEIWRLCIMRRQKVWGKLLGFAVWSCYFSCQVLTQWWPCGLVSSITPLQNSITALQLLIWLDPVWHVQIGMYWTTCFTEVEGSHLVALSGFPKTIQSIYCSLEVEGQGLNPAQVWIQESFLLHQAHVFI